MSQRRVLEQERSASYGFLNDLMRPEKDKAFVIHFDWEIELLQDLTTSHQKLEAALDKLDMPQFEPQAAVLPAVGGAGAAGHHRGGGGTTLYDAIFLASDELMRKQEGRKALILLTDGVDTGSKVSLDRAIETAQRANTLVYSILYADPDAYGHNFGHMGGMGGGMGRHGGMGYPGGGGGGYPQQRRAGRRQEGSAAHLERNRRTFLRSVQEACRSTRSTPRSKKSCAISTTWATRRTRPTPATGYHKITLTTTNKDLIVQTRDGYYAAQ